MASTTIHIAIAKKYCEHHPEENYEEFLIGSNLPDITENKNQTHFGSISHCSNYWEYAKNKVDLKRVVENINLSTSRNRGIFMHLICDYVFFNDRKLIIAPDSLLSKCTCELRKICSNDYDNLTGKMVEKYNINLNEIPEYLRKFIGKDERKPLKFYNESEIYNFIEKMSTIDLYEVYSSIKSGKSIDYLF